MKVRYWMMTGAAVCALVRFASAQALVPGWETDPTAMKGALGAGKSYQTPEPFKYPYISTYYVKPTVTPDEAVKIGFFVTDFESSKIRFLDDSHRFTAFLEYRPKGGRPKVLTLKGLRSGDAEFSLGRLPVGEYELRVWAVDAKGRESHRVIQDFRVVKASDLVIPADKVYKMTAPPGVVKTPQDPCVPMPRLDYGWLEHFAMNRQRILESGGEFDIVFMGDSLTHYWDVGEGPDSSTEIEDLRRTYSILNCAYGGDKTQNLLWVARNGLLDGYKAKLVQLLIGTNNSGDGIDPKDTFEAIRKIVAVIREKQPQAKILLLNLLPRGTAESPAHRRNLEVNALINSENWDDAVIVLDIGGCFIDGKGDTIPELFDGERLHFVGETGYRLWRQAVEPVYRDVVGK